MMPVARIGYLNLIRQYNNRIIRFFATIKFNVSFYKFGKFTAKNIDIDFFP